MSLLPHYNCSILFGGKPCLDPKDEIGNLEYCKFPDINCVYKSNSYHCPVGKEPGVAHLLMLKKDLDTLNKEELLDLQIIMWQNSDTDPTNSVSLAEQVATVANNIRTVAPQTKTLSVKSAETDFAQIIGSIPLQTFANTINNWTGALATSLGLPHPPPAFQQHLASLQTLLLQPITINTLTQAVQIWNPALNPTPLQLSYLVNILYHTVGLFVAQSTLTTLVNNLLNPAAAAIEEEIAAQEEITIQQEIAEEDLQQAQAEEILEARPEIYKIIKIKDLLIKKAFCITPTTIPEYLGNRVYYIEAVDKRYLMSSSCAVQANVIAPDWTDKKDPFYYQTMNPETNSPYTVGELLKLLWTLLPEKIAGNFPDVPDDIKEQIPEGFQFIGVNPYEAISTLLEQYSCTIRLDPFFGVFDFITLYQSEFNNSIDILDGYKNFDEIQEEYKKFLILDKDPVQSLRGNLPGKISVYFNKRRDYYSQENVTTQGITLVSALPDILKEEQDTDSSYPTQWLVNSWYNIDIEGPGTELTKILWGDITAIEDSGGVIINEAELSARANLIAENYLNDIKEGNKRQFKTYCSLIDNAIPGSNIRLISWQLLGTELNRGITTTLVHTIGEFSVIEPVNKFDSPCCNNPGTVKENLEPPDYQRHTTPVYFPQKQYVQILKGKSVAKLVSEEGKDIYIYKGRIVTFDPEKLIWFNKGKCYITKEPNDNIVMEEKSVHASKISGTITLTINEIEDKRQLYTIITTSDVLVKVKSKVPFKSFPTSDLFHAVTLIYDDKYKEIENEKIYIQLSKDRIPDLNYRYTCSYISFYIDTVKENSRRVFAIVPDQIRTVKLDTGKPINNDGDLFLGKSIIVDHNTNTTSSSDIGETVYIHYRGTDLKKDTLSGQYLSLLKEYMGRFAGYLTYSGKTLPLYYIATAITNVSNISSSSLISDTHWLKFDDYGFDVIKSSEGVANIYNKTSLTYIIDYFNNYYTFYNLTINNLSVEGTYWFLCAAWYMCRYFYPTITTPTVVINLTLSPVPRYVLTSTVPTRITAMIPILNVGTPLIGQRIVLEIGKGSFPITMEKDIKIRYPGIKELIMLENTTHEFQYIVEHDEWWLINYRPYELTIYTPPELLVPTESTWDGVYDQWDISKALTNPNYILAGPPVPGDPAAQWTLRLMVNEDLPDTTVVPGTYGTSLTVPQYIVTQKGRLTFATDIDIAIMIGCSSTTNGQEGFVPVPGAGEEDYYLSGEAIWKPVPGAALLIGATAIADGFQGIAPTPTAGQQGYVLYGDAFWHPQVTVVGIEPIFVNPVGFEYQVNVRDVSFTNSGVINMENQCLGPDKNKVFPGRLGVGTNSPHGAMMQYLDFTYGLAVQSKFYCFNAEDNLSNVITIRPVSNAGGFDYNIADVVQTLQFYVVAGVNDASGQMFMVPGNNGLYWNSWAINSSLSDAGFYGIARGGVLFDGIDYINPFGDKFIGGIIYEAGVTGASGTDPLGNIFTSGVLTTLGANAVLAALAAYNTNGYLVQTAANTFSGRTITGTANQVIVTNGDGVAGNTVLETPQDIDTAADVTFNSLALDGLTPSRVVITDGSDVLSSSTVTDTELGYLGGATSNIQDQIDSLSSGASLESVVTTQFDDTSGTLANVTGLSLSIVTGKIYRFEAVLFVDASVLGGSQFAIGGTSSAASIKYEIMLLDNTTNVYTITSRQTALGGAAGQAGTTAGLCVIKGCINCNGSGTLTVQFAQNTANGTSSVLTLSTLSATFIA